MLKKLFTVRNLVILLGIVALFVVSGLLGLKVPPPHVALAAEPLFHIGDFAITNSLFTGWIVMLILIAAALVTTRSYPKDLTTAANTELVPRGMFANFLEWVVEGMYRFSEGVAGKWVSRFFPIVMTIFLFVITSNWLGLVPGVGAIGLFEHPEDAAVHGYVANGPIMTAEPAHGKDGVVLVPLFRPPSTDLNFTLALALSSVLLTQYWGVKALNFSYFRKFFDLSGFKQGAFMGVIMLFVGLLELVAEFAKIISFAFRLFGNIFAGEVLLAVIAFLIPYIASLPFYGLEVFVGFIQALVFMMLSLVFFTVATIGHGSEEHHS